MTDHRIKFSTVDIIFNPESDDFPEEWIIVTETIKRLAISNAEKIEA
jgi:hypothetical protein